MRLSEIFGVLGRRWYIVLLGVLMSLGLAVAALAVTPPLYEARGTLLLMPSKDQLSTGGRNPFLHLDALDGPAGIVMARLNGDETRLAIEAVAPKAEYVVESDPAMRGPTIQVTVTDSTPAGALAILDRMLTMASDILQQVQAEREVPDAASVGSMRLVVDTKAERVTSATVRMVMAALGAGLLATAVLAFSLDGLLLRRRRRIAGREGTPATTDGKAAAPAKVRRARSGKPATAAPPQPAAPPDETPQPAAADEMPQPEIPEATEAPPEDPERPGELLVASPAADGDEALLVAEEEAPPVGDDVVAATDEPEQVSGQDPFLLDEDDSAGETAGAGPSSWRTR
ncbi:MAG: hypothetical protein AAGC63_05755 [Propionicimonas sp.]|nr:hypothetical protein [Propionicimonas sp.]